MPQPAESLTCLVVDDDPDVSEYLVSAIGSLGWTTQAAATRAETREAVAGFAPTVILLDLALGSTDAMEVMTDLTDMKFKGSVILMSGRGHDILSQVAHVGRKMGLQVRSSLSKPFDLEQLRHAFLGEEEAIGSRMTLTARHALEKGQLELAYEPRLDLVSNAITSFEAVVRVRHPRLGIVNAINVFKKPTYDDLWFIAAFAIARISQDWSKISQVTDVPVATTMPACLLSGPRMVDFVRSVLPSSRKWPRLVFLIPGDELPETIVASRDDSLRLQLYGVEIGVDEFGLVPSSLSIPEKLLCSEVVLAPSIVNGAATSGTRAGRCKVALDRARCLGVRAIAKGFVHSEDISVLRILGAKVGQGPALSDALDTAELLARLSATGVDNVVLPARTS